MRVDYLAPAPAGPGCLCRQPTECGPGEVTTPALSTFAAFSWWCFVFFALGGFADFCGLDLDGLGAGAESELALADLLWRCQGHQPADALGIGPKALSSSAQQSPGSSLFIAHPFPLF